jgi:hypothetical protein
MRVKSRDIGFNSDIFFVCAQNNAGEVCIVKRPLHGKVFMGTSGNVLQSNGIAKGDIDFEIAK